MTKTRHQLDANLSKVEARITELERDIKKLHVRMSAMSREIADRLLEMEQQKGG